MHLVLKTQSSFPSTFSLVQNGFNLAGYLRKVRPGRSKPFANVIVYCLKVEQNESIICESANEPRSPSYSTERLLCIGKPMTAHDNQSLFFVLKLAGVLILHKALVLPWTFFSCFGIEIPEHDVRPHTLQ